MRCCCALAATCICLFAVQGAIAPTRACAQSDWRFSFGVCHEGLRHIYPYTQRCDETKSPVKPSPLFNVSCHKTCPAGTHLAAKLLNGLVALDCVDCKPGHFSLGGGLLISGQAGDWHRSWPPGLRSSCSYRRLDGSWHTDGASTTGLTTGVCQIQILSPPTVAGAYYIRATHTKSKGTRSPLGVALFVLAPGDRRLCYRISGNLHPQAGGFTGQRPGASQADTGRRSLNFWLLAAAGGCSYDRKAQVAGMAGAQGVVLAPAAILDIAAGPHGPPEHTRPGGDNVSRTVPIYEFLESQDAQVLAAALRVRQKGSAEMILNDTAVQLCSETEPSVSPEIGTPGNVTYGCNAWMPDELGNSIHSGDNRNFNRMVSSLELSVNIVRKEGYVVFRYQVDAEEGYDGFSFEVDWKEVNSLKAAIGTLPQLLDDLRSHNLPESAISDAEQNLKVGVNLLEANLPRICFLGKTGSGKTSLMNALLDKTLLPAEDTGKDGMCDHSRSSKGHRQRPESHQLFESEFHWLPVLRTFGKAVTSAVTEVLHDPSILDESVLITVNECSVDEWREKKRMLVNVMQGGYADDAGVDVDDMQNVAEAVLKAACPDVAPEAVQLDTPEAREFLQRLENSSQRAPQHFQCSEDARKFLVDRVHLASSDDWVQSVLTSRVLIRGNFPNIPQDCIMVDLPGLEDTNLLRSSVAERYFDLYCNHAWFCLAKTENRIGSNAGLSRQIRALARGGNLDKILLVRTRADEAPKKGTEKLEREHEEFKRLCLQELKKQSSRARSGEGEPATTRRRTGPDSEVAGEASASASSSAPAAAMSFAGYVQATADPGSEDRPAEIQIEAVLGKLQHIGAQQVEKLKSLVCNIYDALQSLARERFQEEQEREAERQERQREMEREEARRADERRRQHLEELRQVRERRAQEFQSRRANLVLNFTQALHDCKRMVQEFREEMGSCTGLTAVEAVVRELQRAKPPNGQTLRALISAGGIYTSTSRGSFDLVETFCGALTIRGTEDFLLAWATVVEDSERKLRGVPNLPAAFNQELSLRLTGIRQQINAMTTAGGPIRSMLSNALVWFGGKGASDFAIMSADDKLKNSVRPALRRISHSLCSSLESVLNGLHGELSRHLLMGEAPPSSRVAPDQPTCIICQDAPAVGNTATVVRSRALLSFLLRLSLSPVLGREAMPSTSSQRNWTDVRVNLTKGAHVLRWQYAKDYSGYTGMDRAQLQLVQVVGTQYADLECFHCHGSGMHSIGGADHCNACLRNQYLSAGRSASLARCQPCPAGKWSVPGSVSAASCVTAEKCTSESVKVALSPCQGGRQHQVRSWILPVICDVNDSSAAALLQGAAGDQECVPCEPNTWRPSNAACVPKTISCPAGHYAVTELVLSRWAEWPKNLSQEVIGPHEEVAGIADVPGGWALNNGSLHMTSGVGGIHITDKLEARLHLDVQVTLSPGRVNYTIELPSADMWADMRFLVDGVISSNIPGFHVERFTMRAEHVTRFQVTGPLWPGRHRLTWSCSHSLLGADLRRVRLLRVAVQGAADAGASECAPCPAGQEVSPNGASCRSCPPGHFLTKVASSTRCTACRPGKFSDTWAATDCRFCGPGTTAGVGAITCDPQPILLTRDFAAAAKVLTPGEVVINVTSAIQRWRAATEGVTGPLLVGGRKFYISLMRPAPPPGDEGGMAYVWEQDCAPADHGGSSAGSPGLEVESCQKKSSKACKKVHLHLQAVALGSMRGVRFTWKKALSGFSLLLRCDTAARMPEPPARSDAAGRKG
ncbi:elapor2 [Symbiodinium sp. CCMP2592]|nr:elapor2 [Symbiodinium sp. CCMP2592]